MQEIFPGVFSDGRRIFTINAVPGRSVYGEKLIRQGNTEYREWDPFRSKLCGAMRKGLKEFPFNKSSKILYLGASTGTTVSHLSDIAVDGEIYAVEMAPVMGEKLMELAERRENIVPIIADARKPDEYAEIPEVDAVYQDVAQPDQDRIIAMNSRRFLKKGGIAMLCVKSQSIDVTMEPKKVFAIIEKSLSSDFEIVEKFYLEPYDKEHEFLVLRLKK
jgi:fibrillarin-like pre-rRNA processing protein